ncbi:MAG TPA: hypothetical protein VMI92_09770 [Steroidobacteraceae bacterium]|nr:hypothetical protein [Steroidobacteraceae bacterium]
MTPRNPALDGSGSSASNDREPAHDTIVHTAQAAASALSGVYCDTLGTFLQASTAVPLPRAARALYGLARLRQWRAIDLPPGEACTAGNWLALQRGVVEGVAANHALALHRELWAGCTRRLAHERDMALQVAMVITLGWNDLARFLLQTWFGENSGLAGGKPLTGVDGMIVRIAGEALDVPVVGAIFKRSDNLLGKVVHHWRDTSDNVAQLGRKFADRHLQQCRLDTGDRLYEFDHPVEQAMPVEILMLLRLRGCTCVPRWLREHAAFQHPAATLGPPGAPSQSERCAEFIHRSKRMLPHYAALDDVLTREMRA